MSTPREHTVDDLKNLFDLTFKDQYKTVLVPGGDEPFYQVAKSDEDSHQIICRSDYFSSALHEIAHWCVAGSDRRKVDDYGYWYSPDGRNIDEQKEFEKFEVKPQALELLFSAACNYEFSVSIDNLFLPDYDSSEFSRQVELKAKGFVENDSCPPRASQFLSVLANFYSSECN